MPIKLVVGLGNPGEGYAATRHNVGFRAVDELARRHGGVWCPADLNRVATLPGALLVAKPQAFMNRSGAALEALLCAEGLTIEEVLVAVDDVDLPLGRLRLRAAGGPGTHNGLRDICHRLGPSFARARMGVGGAERADDLAAYVLSPFSLDEEALVADLVQRAADAIEVAVRDGVTEAMNRYNRTPVDEEPGSLPSTP
jgi:PTH1 family peptidyl-tRNA hydrolase